TPHPGEMARLIGKDVHHVTSNRIDVARDFAKRRNAYVILKGFRTVIATPDESIYINPTGIRAWPLAAPATSLPECWLEFWLRNISGLLRSASVSPFTSMVLPAISPPRKWEKRAWLPLTSFASSRRHGTI